MFDDNEYYKILFESEEHDDHRLLVEGRMLDYAIIAAIGWRFAKKFENWKAFKLGLIDKDGNILRAPKTRQEKDAFTPLDNIILRIKKLIPKRLWYLLGTAYIFKGFFLKEHKDKTDEEILLEAKRDEVFEQKYKQVDKIIQEDPEGFWKYYMKRKFK